jgi:hypothetical protein
MRGTGTERRQADGQDTRGATQSTTPKALKQITQEARAHTGATQHARRNIRTGTHQRMHARVQGGDAAWSRHALFPDFFLTTEKTRDRCENGQNLILTGGVAFWVLTA